METPSSSKHVNNLEKKDILFVYIKILIHFKLHKTCCQVTCIKKHGDYCHMGKEEMKLGEGSKLFLFE